MESLFRKDIHQLLMSLMQCLFLIRFQCEFHSDSFGLQDPVIGDVSTTTPDVFASDFNSCILGRSSSCWGLFRPCYRSSPFTTYAITLWFWGCGRCNGCPAAWSSGLEGPFTAPTFGPWRWRGHRRPKSDFGSQRLMDTVSHIWHWDGDHQIRKVSWCQTTSLSTFQSTLFWSFDRQWDHSLIIRLCTVSDSKTKPTKCNANCHNSLSNKILTLK